MTLRTWHMITAILVGVLFIPMIFSDDYTYFWVLILAWLELFFLGNLIFSFRGARWGREKKLWDLKEFRHHQDFSLPAAADVFSEEKANGSLELKVHIHGVLQGYKRASTLSPLTGQPCLGWTLEVDIFRKSKFGGDGDFTPVVQNTTWIPMFLLDEGVECRVDPPGIINAGHFSEQFFTWATFPNKSVLGTLLDQGLVQLNISREGHTGVRVRETWIAEGEGVQLYGQLTKNQEGLVLRGNGIPEDPDSLHILADRAKEKKRFKTKKSPLIFINLAFLILIFPILALGVLATPAGEKLHFLSSFFNYSRTGTIQVNSGGRKVLFQFYPAGQSEAETWDMSTTVKGKDLYLEKDSLRWETSGSTLLKAWLVQGSSESVRPGNENYPVWHKTHWVLDLNKEMVAPVAKSGRIFVRNHLKQPISLRFQSETSKENLDGYWNLRALSGDQETPGIRLYFSRNKSNVILSTGDTIFLEISSRVHRTFGVGTSPEVQWSEEAGGWVLELNSVALETPQGSVEVLPPSGMTVILTHKAPELDQLDTWRLSPGAEEPKVPFTLIEGQEFTISLSKEKPLYEGALENCPWAQWNQDRWILTPLEPSLR